MRHTRTPLRRAAAALLAAAALPLAPLAAQEAQPATEPPAEEVQQPAPETPQPKAATPAPDPAPAEEAEAAAPAPAARSAPVRRAPARAAVRAPAPRAAVRAPAPAAAAAPAAIAADPAPIAETAPPADAAAVAPGAVEELPAAAAGGTDVVPANTAPAQAEGGSMLPWALGALAIAGLAIYLLMRRRRRSDEDVYEEAHYEEPVHQEPVQAAPQPIRHEPVAAAEPSHHEPAPAPEVAHSPARTDTISTAAPAALGGSMLTAPVIGGLAAAARPAVQREAPAPAAEEESAAPAAAAAAAAPAPQGQPEIDLRMRPVRAGVEGDGARVEFELTVDNTGSGPAEEVRVSTWMLAAGSSDAEQALIAPAGHADTPSVTIAAGEARTLEASVGLPTSEVGGDSVLPVVVAEVTHRLADGTTAHATARFAVGVPDGEELAHFSIENPSGLHEGVVARELGELERS
jgi:hypothetical protein